MARLGVRAFSALLARLPLPGRQQDTNNAPDEGSAWLSGRVFTLCWTVRYRIDGRAGLVDALSVSWGSLAGQAIRDPRDAVDALVASAGLQGLLLDKARRRLDARAQKSAKAAAVDDAAKGHAVGSSAASARAGAQEIEPDADEVDDVESADELAELGGPPCWTRLEEEQDPERGWLATLLREEDEEDAARDAALTKQSESSERDQPHPNSSLDPASAPHAAARARMRKALARVGARLEALGDDATAEDFWRCREPGPGTEERGAVARDMADTTPPRKGSSTQTWWRKLILDAFS